MDWTIYYGDGTTYEGPVELAPARDVQVIAQVDRALGWIAASGTDYYVWRDGRWFGVDKFGLFDYLIAPGWKRVLFGRMLTAEEYNAVWARVTADRGEKAASYKWERKP